MSIWNVTNKNNNSVLLFRSQDGTFRVTRPGGYPLIIENNTFTLIHKKFYPILSQLKKQVILSEAKIIDHHLKTETDDYIEIDTPDYIDSEIFKHLKSNGLKVWSGMGYLYVTDGLKKLFEEIGGEELVFTEGFRYWNE